MTNKELEQLQKNIIGDKWLIDDGADSIENMVFQLEAGEGTSREWIAVGIGDEDGYAESLAYCHPKNAKAIALVPQLIQEILELRNALAELLASNDEFHSQFPDINNPSHVPVEAIAKNVTREILAEEKARDLISRSKGV